MSAIFPEVPLVVEVEVEEAEAGAGERTSGRAGELIDEQTSRREAHEQTSQVDLERKCDNNNN